MAGNRTPARDQDGLLRELEEIQDTYRHDVKQFIEFVRGRSLLIVEGLKRYAAWLDEEHEGKRYSPATINRKIAAAKSRIRYAFTHSASADNLRKRYQLEDVLTSVRLKKIDTLTVPPEKVLSVGEAKMIVENTKDRTVRLMITFLVGTGVRVSEMLGIRLSDLTTGSGKFVGIRVMGKGAKERKIHVKKEIVDRIRNYFQGTTWLFEHHGRPFSRISVTNRIKHEALKTIGREVTARQLRHTWAAIQIQRGRDVKAVAAVLGHAQPGVTLRTRTGTSLTPAETFIDLEEEKRAKDGKQAPEGGNSP
jgi:integrase